MNSSKQSSSKEAAEVVEPSTSTSKAKTGQESLTCGAGGDSNHEVDHLVISQNAPQIGEEEAAENLHKTKAEKSKELRAKVMGTMGSLEILERISKHLPAQDLSNIRGTCVAWNQQFVPEMKKKHKTILLCMDLVLNEDRKLTAELKMEDFTKIMQSSSEIPFANYYFQFQQHGDESGGPEYQHEVNSLLDFTAEFGNTIRKLKLSLPESNVPLKEVRRVIFECAPQITELDLVWPFWEEPLFSMLGEGSEEEPKLEAKKVLPNLKRLRVRVFSEVSVPSIRKLIMDVIQSAAQLDHLDVDLDDDPLHNTWMSAMLQGLLDIDPVQISKLKTLKISVTSPLLAPGLHALNQLASRSQNALQLESLSVAVNFGKKAVGGGDDDPDLVLPLLRSFLQTQSPTLKKLHLHCVSEPRPPAQQASFCIPRLKHLQKLEITGPQLSPTELQFEGSEASWGSFMDTFPELKQFNYNNDDSANELALAHSGVTDLHLWRCRLVDFPRFGLAFPSLSRLDLQNVDSIDTFAMIWNTWPALKRLSLNFFYDMELSGGVLDSFLSGVSIARLNNLREEFDSLDLAGNLTSETLASLHAIRDKYKTRPGVSDLKLLQHFRIESSSQCELTDLGGYLGIGLASSTLQRVVLSFVVVSW